MPDHIFIENHLSLILAYINDNLDQDIKVSILAELAHLSPAHFCRLFKQATGSSPYHYVLCQRITKAKQLLNSTPLKLSEIAFICGFYDQSHFNSQFRSHTGMTPKEYREI